MRVDQLWTGTFIFGNIAFTISDYDFLALRNNFGGNTIIKTVWGDIQAALIYNANNGIYIDVFSLAMNSQGIEIIAKRRTVSTVDGAQCILDSAEPITSICGIKV